MLKYLEALRKHQLNMFWGFFRNLWKSGSRLKNPVLGPDVDQCDKYFETLRKHQLKTFWGIFLRQFLKIRFFAEKSGSRLICRIMLKYHKTLRKHQLNMFQAFWEILENPVLGWKIRFSAQISNYAKIPWNTQKIPKTCFEVLKKFVKIRFSAQTSGFRLGCRTMLKVPVLCYRCRTML